VWRIKPVQSGTPSSSFFDKLLAVFDQSASYPCPVVVSGDFNVHVDVHAVRPVELLQCYAVASYNTSVSSHTGTATLLTCSSPRTFPTCTSVVCYQITHLFILVCASPKSLHSCSKRPAECCGRCQPTFLRHTWQRQSSVVTSPLWAPNPSTS